MDGRPFEEVKKDGELNNNTSLVKATYTLTNCTSVLRMLTVYVKVVRITEQTLRQHQVDPEQLKELRRSLAPARARTSVRLSPPVTSQVKSKVKSPVKSPGSGSGKTPVRSPKKTPGKTLGKLRSNRKKNVRAEKKVESTEQTAVDSAEKVTTGGENTVPRAGSIIMCRWEDPVEDPLSSIEAAGAEKDSSNETLLLISGDPPPPVPPEQVADSPVVLTTVDHDSLSASDTSHSSSRDSRKRMR